MLKFNSILLFSENPKKLMEFYKKVFDQDVKWEEDGYFGFKIGSIFFIIGPHDKVKGINNHPERLILNFEAEDFAKEFERIKNTGAHVIAAPYHPSEDEKMTLATFADIDGNYFQLGTPMKE